MQCFGTQPFFGFNFIFWTILFVTFIHLFQKTAVQVDELELRVKMISPPLRHHSWRRKESTDLTNKRAFDNKSRRGETRNRQTQNHSGIERWSVASGSPTSREKPRARNSCFAREFQGHPHLLAARISLRAHFLLSSLFENCCGYVKSLLWALASGESISERIGLFRKLSDFTSTSRWPKPTIPDEMAKFLSSSSIKGSTSSR